MPSITEHYNPPGASAFGPGHLGASRGILEHLGASWSILEHLGAFAEHLEHLGPRLGQYSSIFEHLPSIPSISSNRQGHLWASLSICRAFQASRAIVRSILEHLRESTENLEHLKQ
jgi:hypothetical protein